MTTTLSEAAHPAGRAAVSASVPAGEPAAHPVVPFEHLRTAIWAMAESHLHQARLQYQTCPSADAPARGWQASVIAGLSCLYSVVRMCEAPAAQLAHFGANLALGADTEARTRLRIAQVLAEWGDCTSSSSGGDGDEDDDDEEERQLKRALLTVPSADSYVETKYAIVAAHCRLLLRRGDRRWAEQRLRAAYVDAQQRRQYRWAQLFMLELSNVYASTGDHRGSLNALQMAIKQAQAAGDVPGSVVMAVQQLSRLVQARSWAAADGLAASLAHLAADPSLAAMTQLWARYWTLRAAAAVAQGRIPEAQEACGSAREALKEWQGALACRLAAGGVAYGGASFAVSADGLRVHGWTYYEAHVWVMLVSACAFRGDDHYDRASGFLRLALEGIARGAADGVGAPLLLPLKIYVLLRIADVNLASQYVGEAKKALDRVMAVLAGKDGGDGGATQPELAALWRCSRDAITLRWA
ncbi:hypothetical protein LPJ61_003536, partial [Coemansia biformis]